ncbi:MAG: alanine--glyoxylate aminotransferase family protein [Pseudomonadota bacterium]
MKKTYLLTPGPTPVPPEVLLAMAQPVMHHRSPEFRAITKEIREGLRFLFQTDQEVLTFVSSGTGAMEAAVANTLKPGDRILVIEAGKFGERWGELCQAHGAVVEKIQPAWGHMCPAKDVAEALKKAPDIKAVFCQANETSTGVCAPLEELGRICRDHSAILVVDAVSALGAMDIPTDRWGLDIVVSGSQKALMLPPGLAFASVSEKAWKVVRATAPSAYYFSFAKTLAAAEKDQGAFTSAVSLMYGLQAVLRILRAEGLEGIFARHRRLSAGTKAAMRALGLGLYSKDNPSDCLTAVEAPAKIDGQKIVARMRDEHGIYVAGGQAQAKGRIFRVSHMGYISESDILLTVAALEAVLRDLGHAVEFGSGVRAAQEVFYGRTATPVVNPVTCRCCSR